MRADEKRKEDEKFGTRDEQKIGDREEELKKKTEKKRMINEGVEPSTLA